MKNRFYDSQGRVYWIVGTCLTCSALVFGCGRDEDHLAPGPTVAQVEDNPAWYAGKKVTLIGEVDDVYSNRSFELEGNRALFDSEVLVLTKGDVSLGGRNLTDSDDVMVSGQVRRFVTADIEREIGWDLTPELEKEWNNKAVIIANSVSRVDELSRWSDTGDQFVSMTAVFYDPDPSSLVGRSIDLKGMNIRETSERGVWIGGSEASQLYVSLSETQLQGLKKGDKIDVQGKLNKVPERSQLQSDWKFTKEQADTLRDDSLFIQASEVKKAARGEQASAKP